MYSFPQLNNSLTRHGLAQNHKQQLGLIFCSIAWNLESLLGQHRGTHQLGRADVLGLDTAINYAVSSLRNHINELFVFAAEHASHVGRGEMTSFGRIFAGVREVCTLLEARNRVADVFAAGVMLESLCYGVAATYAEFG
jgi:hypothetical protein